MLLRVALDKLHTKAQVMSFLVHHVLFHGQTVEDILVVDRHRINSILICQDDACVSVFERSPFHVALIHAATPLQVLEPVLVLWVVQEHLYLVVRLYVLQDDGVALFTSMILVKELLNKGLQGVELDLSRNDDVANLGVLLVDGPLVRSL